LRSYFIEMPRGNSFVERADFEDAYRTFSDATDSGKDLGGEALLRAIESNPRSWLVLRCVLGMSAGEAAWVAVEQEAKRGGLLEVAQTDIREIDLRARRGKRLLFELDADGRDADGRKPGIQQVRFNQILRHVVPLLGEVLSDPCPKVDGDKVHRLEKIDTSGGQQTIVRAMELGVVPYSELLYERLLGRPYATHRDSVSGAVGNIIEDALGSFLASHRIDYRPTKAREAIETFDQAPDFLVPSREPEVMIEAKLTEDDGTARDKVARIQTLRAYEDRRVREGLRRRQIIAVIDGRGFLHRPQDMRKMQEACDGHVYALEQLSMLIERGGPLHPYVGTKIPDEQA
jgi:hypothetical protein